MSNPARLVPLTDLSLVVLAQDSTRVPLAVAGSGPRGRQGADTLHVLQVQVTFGYTTHHYRAIRYCTVYYTAIMRLPGPARVHGMVCRPSFDSGCIGISLTDEARELGDGYRCTSGPSPRTPI